MKIHWIKKDEVKSVQQLHHAFEISEEEIIGIGSAEVIEKLSIDQLGRWISDADVVHAGLCFGSGVAFESVQLCTFNWHFLNPLKDRPAVSWKATRDFILFNKSLLRIVGFIDGNYADPDAALMDWVYRALLAGAKTIHQPLPATLLGSTINAVPLLDEMYFVRKHFNRKALSFYRFCQLFLSGKWLTIPHVVSHQAENNVSESFKLMSTKTEIYVNSYSALIPTIDRYAYITKSIDSLLALPFPPKEIVVVDQTPLERRKPEIYEFYVQQGILKLIFLERAGQSTARNIGLKAMTQPWALLFEDDSEAWIGMVEEHIDLIKKSGCDVSTGVIVPPGADESFIPVRNRRYFLSDIFTTGNAFMKVETALSVGGLDPAFDHGPGADDDFGKRLYRSGKIIVYNFKSIETHHKAPQGGMRVHGIWWRNKSTLFGPFPPVTQTFTIKKYYKKAYSKYLLFNMVLKARKKYSLTAYLIFFFLLPYKLFISIRQAGKLNNSL
jgi:GT2 family glycosyltransferase